MNCVIVIPIYKENLSCDEISSLNQCANIFANRDIKLICPRNLNVVAYEKIFNNLNFSLERFDDNNFYSLGTYSKMLLTPEFYMRFSKYDFMLIYQPDAWVFRDELDYWCNQGFSYIGAPWFVGDNLHKIAGNGGFSLRNISDMIELLSNKKAIRYNPREYAASYLKSFDFRTIFDVAFNYFTHFFYKISFWESTALNEDYAIVKYSKKFMKEFKCAPPNIAMKFSFEVHPEILYKMNEYNLPFGCHAYLKYNPDFWKKFLPLSDQSLEE